MDVACSLNSLTESHIGEGNTGSFYDGEKVQLALISRALACFIV